MIKRSNIISHIQKIMPSYKEVLVAYLFGSYAKNKASVLSDIDIALYFNQRVPLEKRETIADNIKEALIKSLQLKGDCPLQIQILNEVQERHRLLEYEIVYKGIVVYCKDASARAHYEAGAIHRWINWIPHQEKFNRATLKSLGRAVAPYKVYA